MVEILEQIAKILPRVRGPLQLAGLLFTVLAGSLINRLDPSNTQAVAVVGGIGIALVAIPLGFHPRLLSMLPAGQRVFFLLFMLTLLLFAFSASAFVTYKAANSPKIARFDTKILPESLRVERVGEKERLYLKVQAFPLSTDPEQGATIFIGMIVVHDENKALQGGGKDTTQSCAEVESCLGFFTYTDLTERPIYVRPNTPGSPITVSVDIKPGASLLRIWWEFYQSEGANSRQTCVFDPTKIGPPGGIPHLMMQEAGVKVEGGNCFRSFGTHVFYRNPNQK